MKAGEHLTEVWRQVIVLILSLGVSILAAFAPGWIDGLANTPAPLRWRPSEAVLLGALVFPSLILIDLVWLLAKNLAAKKDDLELWELRISGDRILHNIRICHHKLASRSESGDADFFVAYFLEALQALQNKIRDASEKDEIRVAGEHVNLAESLVQTLTRSASQKLKYTWHIKSMDSLFDFYPWLHYFKLTCGLAQASEIRSLEVLLILEDEQTKTRDDVQELVKVYQGIANTDCYLIDGKTYRQISASSHVPEKCVDFALYGDKMLFLGLAYGNDQSVHEASFTRDPTYIADYERLWRSLIRDATLVAKKRTDSLELNPLMTAANAFEQSLLDGQQS